MPKMRRVAGLALLAACAGAAGCTNGAGAPHPSPSPAQPATPGGTQAIPAGTYRLSISHRDVVHSENGHLINLISLLVGRYVLSVREGHYLVTHDGRSAVPGPSPRRTGGEGAYGRYGIWVFLGIPPIGEGSLSGSSKEVTFHSTRGACFQKGASSALLDGAYRWTLGGGRLRLAVAGAGGDGCLGRSFVFTAHPWARQG
jgi:hypothetical protein